MDEESKLFEYRNNCLNIETENASPSNNKPRTDRAEKLKNKSLNRETVVKACVLKSLAPLENIKKGLIQDALIQRSSAFSRRIHAASLAVNHIVKYTYDSVDDFDLASTPIPDVIDQTFIRQLMLGTQEAHLPKHAVTQLHEEFPEYLKSNAEAPRFFGDRNIYSAGAKKYITNVKNHLTINTMRLLKKFIYASRHWPGAIPGCSKWEEVGLLYAVWGWDASRRSNNPSNERVENDPVRQQMVDFVDLHRRVLGLQPGETANDKWIKDNVKRLLPYMVFLLRCFERNGLDKTYDILPICRIRMQYITIDTSVLYGIVKELNWTNSNFDTFKSLEKDQWKSIFNIDRLRGEQHEFTHTVESDGVALSMHFTRPKKQNENSEENIIQEHDRVLGVDPGGVTIMYVAEVLADGSKRKYKLSRSQYYKESGIKEAQKHSEHWNNGIRRCLRDMSTVTTKGTNYHSFRTCVMRYNTYSVCLWGEYTKSRWSRQRFRLYGGKKRSLDNFFNLIEKDTPKGKRTVLAYGSARFNAQKGQISVPTHSAFKASSKRFPTKVIDEFRTTWLHFETEAELQKLSYKKNGTGQQVQLRGLLWCNPTSQSKGKHVDRDLNAALNIRRCGMSISRPMAFRRGPHLEPLERAVSTRIVKRKPKRQRPRN